MKINNDLECLKKMRIYELFQQTAHQSGRIVLKNNENRFIYTMSMNERPLSPHLQIYKPQITSVLSILHRITGAGLALGAVLVAAWLFAALSGEDCFARVQGFRQSLIGQLMLAGWLFSFVYHLFNGIRHLKWDAGYGLDMKSSRRSGWVVICCSILLSILIWMSAGGVK